MGAKLPSGEMEGAYACKLLHISVDRIVRDRDYWSAYTPQCYHYFYVH